MLAWLRGWIEPEDGQTLVEYTLILALISIVTIAVLTAVGQDVGSVLTKVRDELDAIAT
jgi:Flp pilus assembly pilin Flp